MSNQSVRSRGDFNPDLRAVFSEPQLAKLREELKLVETAEDKAMPAIKNELRRKIVQDLAQKKIEKVPADDIQAILKMNAAEDFNEETELN